MMRYALDARTATDHFTGIGRYVVNLARAMVSLMGEDERLVLLHDPTQPSPWNLRALAGERVQLVDAPVSPFSLRQQRVIPQLLRRLGADIYHSPYYLMPYWTGPPTVVTIYDLIPLRYPRYFTVGQRLIFAVAVRLGARAARRVIAVSQATARDVQRFLRLPVARTIVIPGAADPAFRPRSRAEVKAVCRKRNLPEQYVLYLGSNKPHKNLVRLVEAFSRITQHVSRFTLVVAGAWDSRYPEPHQRAEALGLGNSIVWLGHVPEPDLPALYTGATAFVFPSLYEGFGLPVIEAMACGTPVACSNTSSLPEVAGDAALPLDPTSVESIANALHRLLEDGGLRARLQEQGLRQVAKFSWEQTALRTLHQYRQLGRYDE